MIQCTVLSYLVLLEVIGETLLVLSKKESFNALFKDLIMFFPWKGIKDKIVTLRL